MPQGTGRETPFPRATVNGLFAEVAAASPDAVAIEFGAERITCAELDARADRLVRHLRGLGVAAGTRVRIALKRGPELIVATLAVLQAQGRVRAAGPPAHAAERLAFMLEDTPVPVLVTESRLAAGCRRIPGPSFRWTAMPMSSRRNPATLQAPQRLPGRFHT